MQCIIKLHVVHARLNLGKYSVLTFNYEYEPLRSSLYELCVENYSRPEYFR